jgi:hypothetical protein
MANQANSQHYCNDNYSDCHQYEQHKKTSSQYCMCRCIVRNHLFAHAGNGVPKSRPTRKTAANRQKGGETMETNASEVQTGDEQVYKKDLDELIDYINTPMNQEGKDSKRNKKKKMKKKVDETGDVGGTMEQP